jgi:hypothetical protein
MANAYYWDADRWQVNQDGIGTEIHPLVAMLAAIALGGLFVVFLPFIGLYLFGKHVASFIAAPIRALFTTTAVPMAVPGEAHMTGAPGKGEGGVHDEKLEELSKEIQDRRVK